MMVSITSIALCTESNPSALKNTIDEIIDSGAASLLILACDRDGWSKEKLNPILTQLRTPIFGAIFPGILFKNKQLNHGTLVIGLSISLPIIIIEQLSANEDKLYEQLNSYKSILKSASTLLTIFDGVTSNVEQFTEGLYDITGMTSNTVGGGAGFLDFVQRPCILTHKGLLEDAAVIALIPTPHYCGFDHGWEIIAGPYLVTQSKGNILHSINYQPAYDSYKTCIEHLSNLNFNEHEFFNIAQTYPLGIASIDGNLVVRNPIQEYNSSLICVGDIPENATIYLLKGTPNSLIQAARSAAQTAMDSCLKANNKSSLNFAFIIDCVSRAVFLEDQFQEEIDEIYEHVKHCKEVFGALTIGEICNSKDGPIELLNKSIVVALL